MTPADLDLARRLAAVPGIWRAGMHTQHGEMVICEMYCGTRLKVVSDDEVLVVRLDDGGRRHPDLDDGPTRGALLDVAREMWGDPLLHVRWSWTWSAWYVYGAHHRLPGLIGGCPTEVAAIAQAILAAPTLATTPPPAPSAAS